MPYPLSTPPWPEQTSEPSSSSSTPSKRKTIRDRFDRRKRSANVSRQYVVPDQAAIAQAKNDCQVFSGNYILSCYPNSSTTIHQHEWATFVWNSRLPQYAQTDEVNIYLFHGDSGQEITRWMQQPNPTDRAGSITYPVNDSWWGTRGANWDGANVPFLFYWVITPSNQDLGSDYLPQATFTAVQTTYADSVLATISSTSTGTSSTMSSIGSTPAGISTDSNGSIISGGSATSTTSPTSGSGGNVQTGGGGHGLPSWAIAVIVVLGFLAILATCILVFLIMRRLRRNREGADLSHRGSVGSSTPMMAETHANAVPSSPLLGGAGFAAGAVAAPPSSSEHNDGASIISRANSAGDSGLFSGADAAIMADAFRKALRKPDFAGGPVEEESPEEKERKEAELMNRELAEEGRDIRSVSSSRGVRVETMSDTGTIHDSNR